MNLSKKKNHPAILFNVWLIWRILEVPQISKGLLNGSYAADPERNEAGRSTKEGLWQDFGTRVGALKGKRKKTMERTEGSLCLQKRRLFITLQIVWWFLCNLWRYGRLLAGEIAKQTKDTCTFCETLWPLAKEHLKNVGNLNSSHKKRQFVQKHCLEGLYNISWFAKWVRPVVVCCLKATMMKQDASSLLVGP